MFVGQENRCNNLDNLNQYSPLALAYLGDGVYELLVRMYLIEKGNRPVNKLNKEAQKYVSAVSQSKIYDGIFDKLTDEEKRIIKSGRNAKSFSVAKNAPINQYRKATGLETLFGYLKLKGDEKRIKEVFELCLETSFIDN